MPSRPAKTRPPSTVSSIPTLEPAPEVTRNDTAARAFRFGTGMEVAVGRGARRCRCRAQERR